MKYRFIAAIVLLAIIVVVGVAYSSITQPQPTPISYTTYSNSVGLRDVYFLVQFNANGVDVTDLVNVTWGVHVPLTENFHDVNGDLLDSYVYGKFITFKLSMLVNNSVATLCQNYDLVQHMDNTAKYNYGTLSCEVVDEQFLIANETLNLPLSYTILNHTFNSTLQIQKNTSLSPECVGTRIITRASVVDYRASVVDYCVNAVTGEESRDLQLVAATHFPSPQTITTPYHIEVPLRRQVTQTFLITESLVLNKNISAIWSITVPESNGTAAHNFNLNLNVNSDSQISFGIFTPDQWNMFKATQKATPYYYKLASTLETQVTMSSGSYMVLLENDNPHKAYAEINMVLITTSWYWTNT